MNNASAAIAIAPASDGEPRQSWTARQTRQAGPRLDLRVGLVAAHPFPGGSWDRVAARAGGHRLAAPVAGSAADSRRYVAATPRVVPGPGRPGHRRPSSPRLRRPRRTTPPPPRARGRRPADRRRSPPGPGPRRLGRPAGRAPHLRRRTALVRPGPAPPVAHGGGAAQSRGGLRCTGGSSATRVAAARRRRCRPCHRSAQAMARRSGRSPVARRRRGCGPPRASPSPGTSGRRGRRWTGSTPPGARRHAAPVATRRSSDGDGRGSSNVRRGRRQRRRMDRPGHRPCWAALAQSSRG